MEVEPSALLKLLSQLVRVEVKGRDLVSLHPIEEEGERGPRELGSLGGRESPLADLIEKPQLSKLPRQLVRLPRVMSERLGGQLDFNPPTVGVLHLTKQRISGQAGL